MVNRAYREQFEGRVPTGQRVGGRDIGEANGSTFNYSGNAFVGHAANARANRNKSVYRRRAKRSRAQKLFDQCVAVFTTPAQTPENATYWAQVKALLDKGTGLDQAKALVDMFGGTA